jgi:carboxyl-terminal processing protease
MQHRKSQSNGDRSRKWILRGSAVAAGFLSAALFQFIAGKSLVTDFRAYGLKSKESPKAGFNFHFDSELAESIVAIVKGYYVDEERVSDRDLFLGTLKSLQLNNPAIAIAETTALLKLQYGAHGTEFVKNDLLTNDDLILKLKDLSGFLHHAGFVPDAAKFTKSRLDTKQGITETLLNAMLSSLDAHSNLMSSDSYRELRQGTDGAFGGLGVLVGVKQNLLTVLKPIPHSPAQRAGVKQNDRIISIDGFPTFGRSLDQLVGHMKGEPGTFASISILRQGEIAPINLKLAREIVEVESVEKEEFHKGDLHYLQLSIDSFASRTGREVRDAIVKFRGKYPLNGLILDLRSNPGGLLDQAIEVSDLFLKQGVIVSTHGRRSEVEKASQGGVKFLDFPIVVLMNEESASASEIVAGALQDNGRAIILGQRSFGKGSVQTLFELPGEQALKLTIARYLTPAKRSIQNLGITPDLVEIPVDRRDANENLLGPFRYRGESSLPYHLSAYRGGRAIEAQTTPMNIGYHLKPENASSNVSVEFRLAESIFDTLRQNYGNHLPEGAQRSGHWLALAETRVRTAMDQETQLVTQWLQQKHRIAFTTPAQNCDVRHLRLVPELTDLKVQSGGMVEIPWKAFNPEPKDCSNISAFAFLANAPVETKEVLIGNLALQSHQSGVFRIQIPAAVEPGVYKVTVGLSQNSLTVDSTVTSIDLAITLGESPQLAIEARFIDGRESKLPGVLENSEEGTVEFTIRNSGAVVLRDVKIETSNLSGEQVVVSQLDQLDSEIIEPGQVKRILCRVVGRKMFRSPFIEVGLVASSRQMAANKVHILAFDTPLKTTVSVTPLSH